MTARHDEEVVLVDEAGSVLGSVGKLEAHEPPGRLHLAFSVVLVGADGRVLLQRRAASKYHFPGYWSNACCSHPRPGEDPTTAARRRLVEELGLDVELVPAGSFTYRATCPVSGLVEHELDRVFAGSANVPSRPSPEEVAETLLVEPEELFEGRVPGPVTPWLAEATRLALATWASASSR